jgi:hypothetical protein
MHSRHILGDRTVCFAQDLIRSALEPGGPEPSPFRRTPKITKAISDKRGGRRNELVTVDEPKQFVLFYRFEFLFNSESYCAVTAMVSLTNAVKPRNSWNTVPCCKAI